MQNTLDKEKEVVNLLVEKLDEQTDDAIQVISSTDFTEERQKFIVVVGITSTHQVNFGLPDYQYTVQISIDCFIDEDKQGFFFQQTKNQVLNYLEPYIMDQSRLGQLFEDIPIVGLLFDGVSNSVTQDSNKCFIQFRLIASY